MARPRRPRNALREMISDLKRQLRDIDRERNKRQQALDALEALAVPDADASPAAKRAHRKAYRSQGDLLEPVGQPANGDRPKTMTQAAALILKELGRPLHIVEIAEEMRRRWYQDKSVASIRGNLSGTLDHRAKNKDLFTKPERATYGLLSFNGN